MAETSQVWDGILVGDATVAPYSALEWAAREELLHDIGSVFPNYGVLKGTGGGTYPALGVQAKAVVSANVEVQIGAALVNGRLYENTAALTLAIGANASGNARIDTVVLRVDYVAQTIRAAVLQGTPAASPVRPTLTQTTVIYEMPLADVAVANGFTVINQADITNRQRAVHSINAGWQAIANCGSYVPTLSYDASSFTPGSAAWAVPFQLTANMLVADVRIRNVTLNNAYTVIWGIYTQDTNDGATAENTLRLVAQGSGSGTTGGTANISLPATPAPQVLTPGSYWLVVSATVGALQIGRIAGTAFDEVGYRTKSGAPIAAIQPTIDMVTNWGSVADSLAVRVRGRVFGQTAVL